MLLCPHAGLRTMSTKGKRRPGKRNVENWVLATCQEGLPGLRDFHEVWPAAVQQGRGAFPKLRANGFRSLAAAELVFTPVSCRVSVGGVSTIGWPSVLFCSC